MRKQVTIAAISIVFMLSLIFLRGGSSQQHKTDSRIQILIDRAPGGLLPGQAVDVMGRRFLPLLDHYRLEPQTAADEFVFTPKDPDAGLTPLQFTVIRDESTRTLKLMRGEADVLYDTVAISKLEWLTHEGFRTFSRSGLNLSYIGFALHHPILKDIRVRRAIAQALPVAEWAKYKLHNWVDLSTEFIQLPYDPEASKKALNQAGFAPGKDGVRFKLRYFTTSVREGAETALLVQEALKKIGVQVEVITLDTLLYFQKMRKGESDIFFNRWFRFSEDESIAEYLSTNGARNYFGFSDPKLDQRLAKNPVLSTKEISKILDKDFPFFPLYTWRHGLTVGPRVRVDNEIQVTAALDESFRFLMLLGLK